MPECTSIRHTDSLPGERRAWIFDTAHYGLGFMHSTAAAIAPAELSLYRKFKMQSPRVDGDDAYRTLQSKYRSTPPRSRSLRAKALGRPRHTPDVTSRTALPQQQHPQSCRCIASSRCDQHGQTEMVCTALWKAAIAVLTPCSTACSSAVSRKGAALRHQRATPDGADALPPACPSCPPHPARRQNLAPHRTPHRRAPSSRHAHQSSCTRQNAAK